jgi:hypothetical protein
MPIRQIFEKELLNDRIRLPLRFGRTLYDRFNDTYSDTGTDHLLNTDVENLLRGTPNRGRFMAYASRVMRSLIIDYARERLAALREARRGENATAPGLAIK